MKKCCTNCRDCGSNDVYAHYPDYTKQLEVVWLCPNHHSQEHKKLKSNIK